MCCIILISFSICLGPVSPTILFKLQWRETGIIKQLLFTALVDGSSYQPHNAKIGPHGWEFGADSHVLKLQRQSPPYHW
jgi:hypothetical protein